MKERVVLSGGKRLRTLWPAVMLTALVLAAAALTACTESAGPAAVVSIETPGVQTARAEQTPTPDSWERAQAMVSARHYPEAMAALGKIDTEQAQALLARLRYIVNGDYIACAGWTVAALTPPGGVALSTSEDWSYKQEMLEAYNWSGVTALSLEDYGVVGIGPDNTLLYASQYTPEFLLTKSDAPNQAMGRALEDMADWPPTYAFDACYPQTAIALTAEGVYASYPNGMYSHVGKLDGWTDVVDVRDGRSYALGLKADGTVLYRNFGTSSVLDVSGWRDIVAIDAGWVAVGLKSDGTVVCEDGEFDYLGMDVSGWTDIIAVSTCEWCALGLKSDGTVVATGDNRYHQLEVSEWRDIVAIDTSCYLSIGLKADGTLVIAGDCSNTNLPLPDVSGMTGLYVPMSAELPAYSAPEQPSDPNADLCSAQGDFDGDGALDTAILYGCFANESEEPYASVKLLLATGETPEWVFAGEWMAGSLTSGDFDGDGKADLCAFIVSRGSNFDGGEARVLCMENGALSEFPYTVNTNPALPFEQGGTLLGAGGCMIGVAPIKSGERDGLRVQIPIDVTVNAAVPTAWYMDIAFNGEAWDTLSMGLGVAYRNILLPDTGPLPKVETAHRQGFTEAALTFTGSNTIEPQDPYLRYYDWRTATLSPTAQDTAQDMLRQLYDMTGILIDKCYVSGTWDRLYFSMKKDGSPSFLSTGYGASPQDGKVIYMFNINYGGPIDPTEIVKPEGYENMTRPELARWYYDNSSYGDRREIVSAADHSFTGYVKLTLATREFYEVGFDEVSGLPNSFYGPYPEGFTH